MKCPKVEMTFVKPKSRNDIRSNLRLMFEMALVRNVLRSK